MRAVSFLSRFALICNFLFVCCLIMQYTRDPLQSEGLNSIVITLGWVLAPILNLAVCFLYLFRLLAKKPLGVKPWLASLNLFFLLAQIFKHFILAA